MYSTNKRLAPHYTVDELKDMYRREQHKVLRDRLQIIWLVSKDASWKEVRNATGYCQNWLYQLVRRYNKYSIEGLKDGRIYNKGQEPLLTEQQQQELYQLLLKPHSDGGIWTGPKVATWIAEKVGKTIPDKRGWIYLKKLGFTLKRPRPKHYRADKNAQEDFKKNLKTK
jgi:transposase